jgi:tetratricopeptide (TPR) repeat protein
MKQSAGFLLFLWFFACLTGIQSGFAQAARTRLDQGITLYRAGQWNDAVQELRRAQREAVNPGQQAEAIYWLALTEFALGEYETALRDINETQRIAPAGLRIDDIFFYKGRTLYYLKSYEDALTQFKTYDNILSYQNTPGAHVQRSVLAYWMGECYYALGRQDQAMTQFTQVISTRPLGEKHEAAAYRLALIRQTKTQTEILDMLTWSYTEYIRTVEDYQSRLAEAETRIQTLEGSLTDVAKAAGAERNVPDPVPEPVLDSSPDAIQRIRELKAAAEKLRSELVTPSL